ncbi:MAG: hypothetical protein ACRDMJ_19530 [Solirubrobacteraceae bacterium]
MSADYFDRLEAELRAAVPRAAGRSRVRVLVRVRPLPRFSPAPLGLAAAVAVAVIVVVGAIALLGHGRSPTPAPTQPAGPTAPATGAYPTFKQLKDNFAVLRRPQAAADRSWRPTSQLRPRGTLPSLTRLVRRLPAGARVFVTVIREPAGGYTPELWLVEANGNAAGQSAEGLGARQPSPFLSGIPGRSFATLIGLMPDGVARARWTLECDGPGVACGSHVLTVPVRDNVAVAEQPSAWCTAGGACPDVVATTSYGRSGQIVARWPATATPVDAPRVLRADGIARARFGERRAVVLAALVPMLGPPTQAGATHGDCGIDQALSWAGGRLATVLSVYISHGRFVGYQYSGPKLRRSALGFATLSGLMPGDTAARARRIYGKAFKLSFAQGGSYSLRTRQGTLVGYLRVTSRKGNIRSDRNQIGTIDAGHVGCPAMTP